MIYMHFGEQKRQNGPENQMILKLCLENRKYFQTACLMDLHVLRLSSIKSGKKVECWLKPC